MYIGTGFNNYVVAITEISTGECLVGGYFTQYSEDTSNRVIKLNVDGSHNTSFNIGNGFSGSNIYIYMYLASQVNNLNYL